MKWQLWTGCTVSTLYNILLIIKNNNNNDNNNNILTKKQLIGDYNNNYAKR